MNFVFDIDGTICFSNNEIKSNILSALKKLEKLGHTVIFASARSYRDCLPLIDGFYDNIIVGSNGGVVYKNGKLFCEKVIKKEDYEKILEIVYNNDLAIFVDDVLNYSSRKEDEITFFKNVDLLNIAKKEKLEDIKQPIKIVIPTNDKNVVKLFEKELANRELDLFYHEEEKLIYINFSNVTKGSTLTEMLKEDYVAFGNDINDINMFENSIYSVQVGEYEPLKKYASELVLEKNVAEKIIELANKFR